MQPQNQDIISKLMANKKQFYMLIGGVLVLIIIIVTIIANSGDKSPSRVIAMQAHLAALADFTANQSDSLNSASLRDQNANIGILLSGAANDITVTTATVYGKTDPNSQAIAANAGRLAEMQAAIDSAINTNTVDIEYQKLLATELKTVESQLTGLSSSGGRTIRELLVDIRERLKLGRDAFEKVSL